MRKFDHPPIVVGGPQFWWKSSIRKVIQGFIFRPIFYQFYKILGWPSRSEHAWIRASESGAIAQAEPRERTYEWPSPALYMFVSRPGRPILFVFWKVRLEEAHIVSFMGKIGRLRYGAIRCEKSLARSMFGFCNRGPPRRAGSVRWLEKKKGRGMSLSEQCAFVTFL